MAVSKNRLFYLQVSWKRSFCGGFISVAQALKHWQPCSTFNKFKCILKFKYIHICAFMSQVNLVLDDGRSLGLMIRGGAEYALGIYITGVDRGSAAECGGLKVKPYPVFASSVDFYFSSDVHASRPSLSYAVVLNVFYISVVCLRYGALYILASSHFFCNVTASCCQLSFHFHSPLLPASPFLISV